LYLVQCTIDCVSMERGDFVRERMGSREIYCILWWFDLDVAWAAIVHWSTLVA